MTGNREPEGFWGWFRRGFLLGNVVALPIVAVILFVWLVTR